MDERGILLYMYVYHISFEKQDDVDLQTTGSGMFELLATHPPCSPLLFLHQSRSQRLSCQHIDRSFPFGVLQFFHNLRTAHAPSLEARCRLLVSRLSAAIKVEDL